MAGRARLRVGEQELTLTQESRYPWDGRVKIALALETPQELELRLRIPGWAREEPAPSDLHRFRARSDATATVQVAGKAIELSPELGYQRIRRTWSPGGTS